MKRNRILDFRIPRLLDLCVIERSDNSFGEKQQYLSECYNEACTLKNIYGKNGIAQQRPKGQF